MKITIEAEVEYHPGEPGGLDSYGAPSSPATPPQYEISEIQVTEGPKINLNQIEDAILEAVYELPISKF